MSDAETLRRRCDGCRGCSVAGLYGDRFGRADVPALELLLGPAAVPGCVTSEATGRGNEQRCKTRSASIML
eukprot:6210282-Pleurochrysis_carterae.AAC.1